MEVKEFQNSCFDEDIDIVVQKYLIDGTSYFFEKYYNETKEEFYFKKELSHSLGVHLRDIVIVGSGKLGFSIKPDIDNPMLYPFKKFDFEVEKDINKEKSDLDIAIVSSNLFDRQLINIYNHTQSYSTSTYKGSKKSSLANYVLKGWLRPDFIPEDYTISPLIGDVQEKYKIKYGRSINIGIYKSWFFFESYHKNNIKTIKLNLIANS